jgi:putative flippase GtrA
MTTTIEPGLAPDGDLPDLARPAVDIVIPVFNEEHDLERSVCRLYAYLLGSFPFSFRITIADNASTDRTWQIAGMLQALLPEVRALHLNEKGRGRALQAAWSTSDATVLAYMDVDLSTDLSALLPLVAPLISGHSDVAIGSRLTRSSRVERGAKREIISRCYNVLLHATLAARFSDAQCGFKAIRADRAKQLLPAVEDSGWFFDTELLVLAERSGLRIHEVPVDWADDPDSRVELIPTVLADLRGIVRLARSLATGRLKLLDLSGESGPPGPVPPGLVTELGRFALVGVASTLAYLVLFVLARDLMASQAANALALLVTALANTAVNRRLTFGVRGAAGRIRHQFQGLAVFAVGLALTASALFGLHVLAPNASELAEVAVLVAANVAATLVRFVLFRAWIFGRKS